MDKLKEWEERIQRQPREEVANLDYMELLMECRIVGNDGE